MGHIHASDGEGNIRKEVLIEGGAFILGLGITYLICSLVFTHEQSIVLALLLQTQWAAVK